MIRGERGSKMGRTLAWGGVHDVTRQLLKYRAWQVQACSLPVFYHVLGDILSILLGGIGLYELQATFHQQIASLAHLCLRIENNVRGHSLQLFFKVSLHERSRLIGPTSSMQTPTTLGML
jgi:hypothetical protein